MMINVSPDIQIKYGSLLSYGMLAINILLGLLYTPWVLKEIGNSYYGIYTLASSLIALFLMDFGMSAAVTRFVAKYRAENNIRKINEFVGLTIKFYLILLFAIGIALVIVYLNVDSIYSNLTLNERSAFKTVFIIASLFVCVCFPVNLCNGILNAFELFLLLKSADLFNKIFTVIFTIIALLLHGGLYALVFINGLFNLLTYLLKVIIVFRKTTVRPIFYSSRWNEIKELFSFTAWTTVSTVSQQMFFNLVPSILAMVTNTFTITVYGFASVIEGYVYNISSAISGFFFSKISRLIVKETNAEKTLPLMIKVGRINQSVITLLIIGLTLLGKEFVNLWLGDDYKDIYYCILFLSTPYLLSASQQIGNSSLVVLNKVRYSAIAGIVAGILNLLLCYFIAGKYGALGACFVTGLVFWMRVFFMSAIYKSVLKINMIEFYKACHLQLLPAAIGGLVTSFLLLRLLPEYSASGGYAWILFGGKVILVSIIYFVWMWVLGWNQYEKSLIRLFIPLVK